VRVAVVLEDLRPSGGVGVALGHARRMAARPGWEVDVVARDTGAGVGAPAGTTLMTPRDAAGQRYDVVLATWWETLELAFELNAGRHAVLVQSLEPRFYRVTEAFERLGAAVALGLPLAFLPVSHWMCDWLREVRPGARVVHVPNGIDKHVFVAGPGPRRDGPLRVLVDGQPSLWFKGVDDALAAVDAMAEPAEVTLVALEPPHGVDGVRVAGGLDAAGMAALYGEHDVLLKLSRVEGLGLPPLEAAHVGIPSVVTPYTGHDEVVTHGESGLIVGFDDVVGTAAALDGLARDRARLRELGDGARRRAEAWPDPDASTSALAAALEALVDRAPPHGAESARAIVRALRRERDLGRGRLGDSEDLAAALADAREREDRRSTEIDRLNDLVDELSRSRDEAGELLAQARAQLDEVTSSRAYQAALRMRKALGR
jgi:glycosyltransferase involved in cell wall biosynthesis